MLESWCEDFKPELKWLRWFLTYKALLAHDVNLWRRPVPEYGGVFIYVKAAAWKGSRGEKLGSGWCASSPWQLSLSSFLQLSGHGEQPGSPAPAVAFVQAFCQPLNIVFFPSLVVTVSFFTTYQWYYHSALIASYSHTYLLPVTYFVVLNFIWRCCSSCVSRTVKCRGRGGCLLSTLLLGLGCDQREWLQDGLLLSLFQVHGFIWGQRGGEVISSSPSSSSDSQSHTQLWSICSGHLHRATQWPFFLAAERSEIVCWVISLVFLKGGKKVCQNTSAETRDAQMLRTMHILAHMNTRTQTETWEKTAWSRAKALATRQLRWAVLLR